MACAGNALTLRWEFKAACNTANVTATVLWIKQASKFCRCYTLLSTMPLKHRRCENVYLTAVEPDHMCKGSKHIYVGEGEYYTEVFYDFGFLPLATCKNENLP